MEELVGTLRCPESFRESARSADPTSTCDGSAEWNLRRRSRCREKLWQENGMTLRLRISCFFSNTSRCTQLAALLIDPACSPQHPDRIAMTNQAARICHIRSFPSIG